MEKDTGDEQICSRIEDRGVQVGEESKLITINKSQIRTKFDDF